MINGTELFDSSQSYSEVKDIMMTKMYYNLFELGFIIEGVTCGENYDDFYQKKNPIPVEYNLNPVDYRVDIYSSYSDDIYETFIKEGLEVHKLFNNGNYCNSKNDKLVMHSYTCYKIKDDEFAHGGFVYNEGKWSTDKCKGYYCDIGYYYDQYENKCKKECPYDENKKYFLIYEKDLNKTFNIEPGMIYQFSLFKQENYLYSFETSQKSLGKYTKLFLIHSGQADIENSDNKILPVRIRAINISYHQNLEIRYSYMKALNDFIKAFDTRNHMYLYQPSDDSLFYTSNILDFPKVEVKLARYNNNMNVEEILKISNEYFSNVIDNFIYFKKDQLYIVYYNFAQIFEIDFWVYKLNDELIHIKNDKNNLLFFEKNKNYILDFKDFQEKHIILKLSCKILNSEVLLIDENIKLNLNNRYYALKENFSGRLNIMVGKRML